MLGHTARAAAQLTRCGASLAVAGAPVFSASPPQASRRHYYKKPDFTTAAAGRERAVQQEKKMGHIVHKLKWINAYKDDPIPRYRVMDLDGKIIDGAEDPQVRV